MMRTPLNLSDAAPLIAEQIAARERLSRWVEAVSQLVQAGADPTPIVAAEAAVPLRGRFALLPCRDEIVTPEHVRGLMEHQRGLT